MMELYLYVLLQSVDYLKLKKKNLILNVIYIKYIIHIRFQKSNIIKLQFMKITYSKLNTFFQQR